MAQTSFPFDSQTSTESDWSHLFRQLTTTTGGGVEGSPNTTELKVTGDSSGMNVKVAAGNAIVRGHYYMNDAIVTLTIGAAAASQRIDSIVLTLDPTANSVVLAVVAGTAGSGVAPTLTQTDTAVYQLKLADVTVPASASTISAGNVADLRSFAGNDVGVWTTATRPTLTASNAGLLGYNTTTGLYEGWTGSAWAPVSPTSLDASVITSGALAVARGGTGQSSLASGFLKSNGTVVSGGNVVAATDISAAEQANIVAGKFRNGGTAGGSANTPFIQSATPAANAINDLWFW